MFLKEIRLKNFRNYINTNLDFSPNINIIYGKNAQGKTNILESIALLCLGRSFRTNKDSELINWNAESCYLRGVIDHSIEENFIEDQIEIGIGHKQKKIKLNNQEQKPQEIYGKAPVVIFSPDDLQLIKGGPQFRRDFIDLYLAQIEPNYRQIFYDYYKVLQQRNRFLKERYIDLNELEVWNEQLVVKGVKVIKYRAHLINRIEPFIVNAHSNISNNKEVIKIDYISLKGINIKNETEADLTQIFHQELKDSYKLELERKITLIGPQRDDLRIMINNTFDLKTYGSQGQQRTAALSLKLGLVDIITQSRNKVPLLLLDDVMSEFDNSRKQSLLNLLISSAQTFMTSTSKEDFPVDDSNSSFFLIDKGEVKDVS